MYLCALMCISVTEFTFAPSRVHGGVLQHAAWNKQILIVIEQTTIGLRHTLVTGALYLGTPYASLVECVRPFIFIAWLFPSFLLVITLYTINTNFPSPSSDRKANADCGTNLLCMWELSETRGTGALVTMGQEERTPFHFSLSISILGLP